MMIRSVAVLACLITAAVMGYFIRDINRRFPNPSVCEQYTKDSPAMLDDDPPRRTGGKGGHLHR